MKFRFALAIAAAAIFAAAGTAPAQQPIIFKFSHVVAVDTPKGKSGKTEILTLTPEQKAAMKNALVPVHKENEGRIGKAIIDEVYREIGFKP
jgi:C4-dicarboxylate-binding protein DctP